jgi:protein TIF31
MSGFHPPIQAQLSGDLFYIHAKTLENADLHITASPLGFFLNQSKINNYNPTPVPGRPTYTSLLDLLSNCSERFSSSYAGLSELKDQSLLEQLSRREDSILLASSDKF